MPNTSKDELAEFNEAIRRHVQTLAAERERELEADRASQAAYERNLAGQRRAAQRAFWTGNAGRAVFYIGAGIIWYRFGPGWLGTRGPTAFELPIAELTLNDLIGLCVWCFCGILIFRKFLSFPSNDSTWATWEQVTFGTLAFAALVVILFRAVLWHA